MAWSSPVVLGWSPSILAHILRHVLLLPVLPLVVSGEPSVGVVMVVAIIVKMVVIVLIIVIMATVIIVPATRLMTSSMGLPVKSTTAKVVRSGSRRPVRNTSISSRSVGEYEFGKFSTTELTDYASWMEQYYECL